MAGRFEKMSILREIELADRFFRPCRAWKYFVGRFTQGSARRLALPWAITFRAFRLHRISAGQAIPLRLCVFALKQFVSSIRRLGVGNLFSYLRAFPLRAEAA